MNIKRAILNGICGAALYPAISSARAAGTVQPVGPRAGYFPNAVFETQYGQKVKFYDDIIKGKLVVVNMMYTACTGICPSNTANLLTVQQALGDRVGRDIHMISLTLQPEIDSPAALQAYAKKYGVKPGWTFLTGKRPDMDLIRRKLGFYDTDAAEDAKLSRHTGMLTIGNEPLDRWCMMPALTATHQLVSSIVNMT
jgi:protein SCO1/2